MAPWTSFHLLRLLSVILFTSCVVEQPRAFTIKLIHRYAPESPFYNANLTYQEIIERMNFQTRFSKRKNFFTPIEKENKTSLDLKAIRPSLDPYLSLYLVKVSLGTFSSRSSTRKSYYLDFDTGSELTWLQCEDCLRHPNNCYHQSEPPYPNSKSSSYQMLPCDRDALCIPGKCIGDWCSYHNTYADDSHSTGILAREMFAFPSASGHEENVVLVFGCGIDNIRTYLQHVDIKTAGYFGMGWGHRSFVRQILYIAQGKFSYCLPPISQAVHGLPVFLRFGSDIPHYSSLPSTRLLEYELDQSYYVNLLDMSINNARLHIPSAYFQKGEGDNIGGCILDTGTTATHVSLPAYRMFKQAMEIHIAREAMSLEKVPGRSGYDLCYRMRRFPKKQHNLPSVTFHFEGNADLMVRPETAFYYSEDISYEYICLAMVPTDDERLTMIGSNIQTNHFFVFDVIAKRVYFSPRDCSRNQ
uniref:Peptidase A1 domain-containing protein n=1 Tax=Kalanchoe fedtschenkoi TaxID=63787 RepID=A0A7N0U6Z4_KALFE